ncbi:MAG TPA: preprotein translocase subunit YajC [Eubacteriaceae bacterium]|jgi:preprotein translocase subunit YajC|nr:preprotein translocase subunit YajC [Eubacteriaceae bacterium]
MNFQELLSFVPIIAVFGFFYFFVIRPQSKQQKKIQSMRNELKKGDKIVTIGGFYGKIIAFKDDVLTIELKPDNIKVQITRSAVADVLNKAEEGSEKAE